MEKDTDNLFKFPIKYFFIFLLTVSVSLSCTNPAIPKSWFETAVVKEVNIAVTPFTVSMEGYPYYSWEIFDNPLFEGSPVSQGSSTEKTFTLTGAYNTNTAYYLRIKSLYGEWQTYGGNIKSPKPLIYQSTGTKGSSANPYILNTISDLIAFSEKSPERFTGFDPWMSAVILTADIDLTGVEWKPIGTNGTNFTGTFNGGGHIISGINKFNPAGEACAGLFGYIDTAAVRNLGLKLGEVNCEGVTYLGGIAGHASGNSTITNCYVSGTALRGGENSYVGGLLGDPGTSFTEINNCYTDITVEGKKMVGGLVGDTDNANIQFCYVAGDVIYSGTSPTFSSAGGIYPSSDSGTPYSCIVLSKKIINKNGGPGNLYIYGRSDDPPGVPPHIYYSETLFCPNGIPYVNGTIAAAPVNPFTMNSSVLPFSMWDFTGSNQYWKWDDVKNRPILRKIKQ